MSAELLLQSRLVTKPAVEPVTLVGAAVSALPARRKNAFAGEISDVLAQYPHFLGQLSANEIRTAMDKGKFALVVDHPTYPYTLFSGAQVLGPLKDPHLLDKPLPETTMVVGTWVSLRGFGKRALNAAADHAAAQPNVRAVTALVGETNAIAMEKIRKTNALEVGSRPSERVKGPNGAAQVIVFRLR